ncbi:FAD-binding oxidoreductase [soil metagenome]
MEQEGDLRGGYTLWEASNGASPHNGVLQENIKTDVVIVGAGITGSFIAEKLSEHGRSVVVVDRNRPQMASTAASTALLLWEIDKPLREVALSLGTERAIEVYRASFSAVQGIRKLVRDLGLDCDCVARPSLYLAGTEMGPSELADEHRIRETAGFSGSLLDAREVGHGFGFTRPAALFYEGAAEVDPVALARGLMKVAVSRGTRLFSPADVVGYDTGSAGVTVTLGDGHEIGARTLILANGYDMPDFVPADAHSIVSTWVVATAPAPALSWPGDAVVWEASDPYLYLRRTAGARFIIGGEDEELTDADQRDGKIMAKMAAILKKQRDLWPCFEGPAQFAWAGFFGTTDDGLPLIGPVPGHPNTYAAFGYGGNGITFSAIAADLIANALGGRSNPLFESFAIDR